MAGARWLGQRRFGVMFDVSMATVPAWAPVGQQAAWYWAHLDGSVRDVHLHQSPIVETLQHHRDRWAHIEHYDDFCSFLHFEDFDPDGWASLARDAGMGYVVMTAKHHDGLCWWDAPGTDRTVLNDGPGRNVLGDVARACSDVGLAFGASYSLLDWGDDEYPGRGYVDGRVHPQVLDLVERYGITSLWGDGHWGAGGDHWRSNELHAAARRINPELVIDDRWWADRHDVSVIEHRLPDTSIAEPWVFRRPLGASASYNRNEPDDFLLSAREIVALLTEVVARGGGLMLQVGPDASGAIPVGHADRLRAVGGWVRRHLDLIDRGRPWTAAGGATWGDADAHLIDVDGALHAVDISGQGSFRALVPAAGTVSTVRTIDGMDVDFEQTDRGVQLRRPPRRSQRMPAVYRVGLMSPLSEPIALFDAGPPPTTELAPLLTGARAGDIIQLGDGEYLGPAHVPDGVTLRGLGPTRTTIDGRESTAVTLGADSRLEHCRAVGGGARRGRLPRIVVRVAGQATVVLGCQVRGHVAVEASAVRIVSCVAEGVVAEHSDSVGVLRSTFTGNGTDVGVAITGGASHLIDGCEFAGHLAAVDLTGCVGASVRHNRISARWWAIRLTDTEATTVAGNAIERTMRAVDVDGGSEARITGNAAADGDSGCVLQGGTSNAEVTGNYWERCRVGLLVWGAGEHRARDNGFADLTGDGDHAVTGP